jgi:hypothetical protein
MFFRAPNPEASESVKPRCVTCERAIAPGTSSVAFPAYHARCIERSVARARAVASSFDPD